MHLGKEQATGFAAEDEDAAAAADTDLAVTETTVDGPGGVAARGPAAEHAAVG